MPKPCHCGSGEFRTPLYDARGVFCAYVCSKCDAEVRGKYRADVFTDSDYWTDEPVEDPT